MAGSGLGLGCRLQRPFVTKKCAVSSRAVFEDWRARMTHFFRLQDRMDEVAAQYFAMMQAASDHLPHEMAAVIKVQSVYRASKVRKRYHRLIQRDDPWCVVILIQRVMRGFLGRARTRAIRLDRNRRQNALFFHHCAAVVQKFFRGWWSRRHLHHYYGRKDYLATVQKRGEYTSAYLTRAHQEQLAQAKANEETQMRKEFDNLAGELHHLISTKNCPGVYNPPYNDALPRAFDLPIEQHLRDALCVEVPRSLRRPPRHRVAVASASPSRAQTLGVSHNELRAAHGATYGGPPQALPDRQPHQSRTASVGRMQKIQGPFRTREQIEVSNAKASNVFRSLQAAAPYDAVGEERKMEARLSKLTRVSPADFVAPGLPTEKPPPSSVHVAVPFRERPVEMRNDYVELPKIRDKPPFFTALPRDKNFEDLHEDNLLPAGHV